MGGGAAKETFVSGVKFVASDSTLLCFHPQFILGKLYYGVTGNTV